MRFVKAFIATALVAAVSMSAAQAQTMPASPAAIGMHGLIAMDLTGGGDKLANPTFTSGNDVRITAGGLAAFKGGFEFSVANNLAIQTTIGYHFDRANASNGSITFQRFPLEALALYSLTPQFRLGGGLRAALSPSLSGSGAGSTYVQNTDYNTKLAFVLEGEFRVGSNLGLAVRAVSEKYGVSGSNSTVDGSHGGISMKYYF